MAEACCSHDQQLEPTDEEASGSQQLVPPQHGVEEEPSGSQDQHAEEGAKYSDVEIAEEIKTVMQEGRIRWDVSEEVLDEAVTIFEHFDEEKSGTLNYHQFKDCLRALGFDLPVFQPDTPDNEFDKILEETDRNHNGRISLRDYMNYIILRKIRDIHDARVMQYEATEYEENGHQTDCSDIDVE